MSEYTRVSRSIEYHNGSIELAHTAEGRMLPSGGSYTYEYMLKDHLGNIRAMVKSDGSIIDISDYYAFGLEIGDPITPSPDNKYKYNGKEWNTELSLNSYDYGARFYDPVIGRWNVVDPLAEQMRSHSPYNYVFNNPMRFIDPDGMAPTGDYFDLQGNFLGSDNVNDKEIRIVNTSKNQLSSMYSNLPFNFKNKDGSVNRSIGLALSKNVSEFGVGDRTSMAGNIYNHYYEEAGYDLGELQSGGIDNTKGGWEEGLAFTKMGGVTRNSSHLGLGGKGIEVDYSQLGRVLGNGNDVMNLFSHERGGHMNDLLRFGRGINDAQSERSSTLLQLNDKTWQGTSPAFRNHIKTFMGGYLNSSETKKYFP